MDKSIDHNFNQMIKVTITRYHFGHLVQRIDSLENTLKMGKIEGKRRRGRQRTRWLDSMIDSMDMNLSKLWETVKDRGGLHAIQSMGWQIWTRLSDWRTIITGSETNLHHVFYNMYYWYNIITYAILLPQVFYLNLVLSKHKDQSTLREILQSNWPWLLKKCLCNERQTKQKCKGHYKIKGNLKVITNAMCYNWIMWQPTKSEKSVCGLHIWASYLTTVSYLSLHS